MASVAPAVTSTSRVGVAAQAVVRAWCSATASRSGAIPGPGGYWLAPSAMASLGGLSHRGGTVDVGEALPEVHRAGAGGERRHLGEHGDGVGPEAGDRHDS